MASSLELGKLVTASYLYRYWSTINTTMRTYLFVATIVLVFVTSLGIYGYLSNAYQRASLELNKQLNRSAFIEEQIKDIQEEQDYLMKEMEAAINSYPENYMTAKRKVREEYSPIIQSQSQRVLELKSDLAEIKQDLLDTGVDVGPAIFVANFFKLPIDLVVNIFIFLLIFVFDPLAVMLVVAYNRLIMEEENMKDLSLK